MTEHPTELLLEVASGAVPPPEARAHLAACRRCRGALEAMAPLDLGYVWQGVAAELDAPRPGPLERALVAAGVRPRLARFTVTTPSLRLGWLLANLLVLALIAVPLATVPAAAWPSGVLLAAPLVAAAAVAFAYGPAVDPAYEAVAVTRCPRCGRCWYAWPPPWSPTPCWPAPSTWRSATAGPGSGGCSP
jgi:hypothetical protein